VVGRAAPRPPAVRLAAAGALAELGRTDEAKGIVGALDRDALAAGDRAALLYLQGIVAGAAGDHARALDAYRASLAADPRRADAATNAISLLREQGDDAAFAEIGRILAAVPATVKAASPA